MKTSMQYPKMVMLIRHGEKPGDPSEDESGGPHLSILGSARAAALPSLFTPDPIAPPVEDLHQLTCELAVGRTEGHFTGAYNASKVPAGQSPFLTPDFLFASKSDKGSHRPYETIKPLEQALQCFNNPVLRINHTFTNTTDGIDALTSEILANPIYAGKVILICWHHGKIPQLAEAFGVPWGQLPWIKWPPTIFDLIFCITWKNGQANLDVANQLLLHSDPQDRNPAFTAGSITPVLDAPLEPGNPLPKNFRSMNGPNLKGIKGKLASGSAQYSPEQLQYMIRHEIGNHALTVVDLRQESHGFLKLKEPLNDASEIAVSWFAERDWINVAKGLVSIEADEIRRLTQQARTQTLELYTINLKTPIEAGICMATPHRVSPDGSYQTEEKFLHKHHIGYLRLPTTDRCRPRDSEVDQFIAFETSLQTKKEDLWLHFHCRAGDGRTTTFMAMHDIYHNANLPGGSLDSILDRQKTLGGVDLSKPSKSSDSFEHPFELERLEFIKNFYKYVCHAKPRGFDRTWSEWVSDNTTDPD